MAKRYLNAPPNAPPNALHMHPQMLPESATQMHPQMGSKRSNAIIPFVWIRTRAIRSRLQDSFHTI